MAINLSQAFHRTSANPIDETLALTKAEMLTINDNLMPSKYLSVCQDDGFIYLYDKTNSADVQTGKFRKFEGGQQIQVSAMPTAVAALVDKIVQFVGTTDSTYTNGYFYKCVNNSGTYSWVATPVQSDGGTSDYSDLTNKPQIGGVTLSGNKSASDLGLAESSKAYQTTDYVDGTIDFTAVIPFLDVAEPKTKKQTTLDTIKNKLKTYFDTVYGAFTAGTGINITNNVISTKQSQQGDIDEIVDVYPTAGELVSIVNAFNKSDIYSTTEKMIGQWTNGKPLYQRVFTGTTPTVQATTTNIIDISSLGADMILVKNGYVEDDGGSWRPVNCFFNDGSDDNGVATWIRYDKTHIAMCVNNTECINKPVVVVLNYTKTTDTAISVGEENEYSTTEKIVGTWINGKPVFQKTLSYTTPATDDATAVVDLGVKAEAIVNAHNYLVSASGASFINEIRMDTQGGSISQSRSFFTNINKSDANTQFHMQYFTINNSDYFSQTAYITIQYTKVTT